MQLHEGAYTFKAGRGRGGVRVINSVGPGVGIAAGVRATGTGIENVSGAPSAAPALAMRSCSNSPLPRFGFELVSESQGHRMSGQNQRQGL